MRARDILLIPLAVTLTAAAGAEEILETVSWPELAASGKIIEGRVMDEDGNAFLRVEGGGSGALTVLRQREPAITRPMYAFAGEVRYRDVSGEGYLEMWSHFPNDQVYFSRALSASGPLQSLRGSASWRPFLLPFMKGDQPGPEKLVVNVVLPESGSVDLRSLRLVQYDQAVAPAVLGGRGDAWWGPRTGGMIGAVAGICLGLLFPAIGILIHRGRAPRTVRALVVLLHLAGDALLVAGVVAMVKAQPYAVYYPLLLIGFLTSILSVVMLSRARHLQGRRELRRLEAMDAG